MAKQSKNVEEQYSAGESLFFQGLDSLNLPSPLPEPAQTNDNSEITDSILPLLTQGASWRTPNPTSSNDVLSTAMVKAGINDAIPRVDSQASASTSSHNSREGRRGRYGDYLPDDLFWARRSVEKAEKRQEKQRRRQERASRQPRLRGVANAQRRFATEQRRRAKEEERMQRVMRDIPSVAEGSILRRCLTDGSASLPSTSLTHAPSTHSTNLRHDADLDLLNVSTVVESTPKEDSDCIILSQTSQTSVVSRTSTQTSIVTKTTVRRKVSVLQNISIPPQSTSTQIQNIPVKSHDAPIQSPTQMREQISPSPSPEIPPSQFHNLVEREEIPPTPNPEILSSQCIAERSHGLRNQVTRSLTNYQEWYDNVCRNEEAAVAMLQLHSQIGSTGFNCNLGLLPQLRRQLERVRAEKRNLHNILTSLKNIVGDQETEDGM